MQVQVVVGVFFFTLFIQIYARILQFLHAWVEKYQNTSWLSCLHHKIYDYRKNQFFFFSEITTFIYIKICNKQFFLTTLRDYCKYCLGNQLEGKSLLKHLSEHAFIHVSKSLRANFQTTTILNC